MRFLVCSNLSKIASWCLDLLSPGVDLEIGVDLDTGVAIEVDVRSEKLPMLLIYRAVLNFVCALCVKYWLGCPENASTIVNS